MALIGKHRLGQYGGVAQQIVSFGAGEALARGLNWGLMALLPLLLTSTEEYGKVGLLVSIEILISNVSLMGMDRAVLRFYENDEWRGKLLRSVLAIWAALAWLPLAAVLGLYLMGRETFFSIPVAPHLFLLSVIVAIFNLNLLCISIGRAQRHLAIFLRFRLGFVGLKCVCVLLMARLLGLSLSYVAGMGVAALIMLIFIVLFLRGRVGGRADRAVVGRMLIFGWPLVFHVISGNIFDHFGRFFLQVYSTTKDVGVFTLAFTLGSGLYVIYASLTTYFEPRIYSHADDTRRCEQWLAFYTNACVALASLGAALLILLYPYLASYLSADYGQALPIIPIIMGGVLLRPLYLQGNYRLTACERTGYIAAASFLSAFLSLALNLLLIPSRGIWGAAMAMYITHFFLATCILVVSLRIAHIPLRQQYSWPTYIICSLGSLAVIIWADRPGFAILALLTVCMTSSGLLVRMFMTIGARPR